MGKFFDTIRKNFNGHSLNNFGNWSLCIILRDKFYLSFLYLSFLL